MCICWQNPQKPKINKSIHKNILINYIEIKNNIQYNIRNSRKKTTMAHKNT